MRSNVSNVASVQVVQVVRVESVLGEGTEADPARRIVEVYDMDGALIARNDPYAGPRS